MKFQRRESLRFCCWVSVLVALVLTAVSSRYLSVESSLTGSQQLFFYIYAAGQLFLFSFLLNLSVSYGASRLLPKKISWWVIGAVNAALLVLIVTDTYVFQLYRFHLNCAMIDLFVNGGSEVIHFSMEMWLQIGAYVLCICAAVAGLLWLAGKLAERRAVWPAVTVLTVCYLSANFWYAFASAKSDARITWMSESVPWAFPLTMNSFLRKVGLAGGESSEDQTVRAVCEKIETLRYPRNPLVFSDAPSKENVIFIVLDSLRADMLSQEVMPNTWSIAQKNITFSNYYSSGNSTRAGIFGLFYGLPPSYWHSALRGNVPPAMMLGFQKKNYDVGIFSSAAITRPEFDKTAFHTVKDKRLSSDGGTAWERDLDSIRDFERWVVGRKTPFFSFIFLDNIHGYRPEPGVPLRFTPSWETVNNLELSPSTDPTEYFNLYNIAVFSADKNVGRIWSILERNDLLENSIVIITGDHGEEFNDNKRNYWGHNGNFSDAQIKVPLVVSWPGKSSGVRSHVVTAYDISTTIMRDVLHCSSPVWDYSVGKSLWKEDGPDWFLVGDYESNAVVEKDRIAVISSMGTLQFVNRNYGPAACEDRSKVLLDAVEQMSWFR